ncbi:unnamed protein product [Rotaria magnacalcarata]|uniref:Transcription elongation factor SPT5 n=5 Tax=Rotaria magnacalcarata TaxID=392030 RepID=A0A816NMZ0_9BILA|nr:unnamed protein product [Rotaria magnacalcarata]CAF1686224.1 unnamed protein product [Rotaria magnacalcarata]CAF2036681.1 unnamed protein product [Rotaria magnacalcarata]CAF2037365.1 unnamed protein product [Rotaria magnacalcarata]CAF2080600.1 unnamed protein product [Rotaria magnacalcarata]
MSDSEEHKNDIRKMKSKKRKTSDDEEETGTPQEEEDDDEEVEGDEDDEEEDEDDEDDDEDEEENRNKRKKGSYQQKRKKKKISGKNFIIDEADVDDDEEEEEEEDAPEEGFVEQTEIHDTTAADIYRAGRSKFPLAEDGMDPIAMEKYINERYGPKGRGTRGDYDEYDDGEQVPDEITQQSLLPDVKSPNLWPVKCRIGEERQTALLLMRKYLSLENNEKALQIKSVVVKEGDRGYIYIEAFKSNHVKAACDDIRSLNVTNLQMVPIKGMTDILRVVKTTYGIKKGSWVRVKRGVYRDDLAKVEQCDMVQNLVTLKLIPRIDYSRKRGGPRGISNDQSNIVPEPHQAAKKKSRFAFKRPPAKLFDETAVEAAGGQIKRDIEHRTFEGGKYDDKGFLIKNFPLVAVSADGITPSISELDKFEETLDGPESNVSINKRKTSKNDLLSFAPGDHVEVCEGELINLQGTIVGIDGDSIRILPKHEALKDEIPFRAHELRKYFSVGNHVKVLSGRFEGETGMIVGIEGAKAIVLSDGTKDEMSVRTSDLQITKETATGVDSTGQFQLRDLVNISADKVGVVVRIEKERLHVLNMDGKVQLVPIQSVTKRKINRNATALDSQNNNLNAGDIVNVNDGLFANRQGQIKHLYRHFVFIFCRTLTENGGLFVCKARNLSLAGGASKVSSGPLSIPMNAPYMSPRVASSPSPHTLSGGSSSIHGNSPASGGGRTPNSTGGGGPKPQSSSLNTIRRDTALIGQTVRISQGPYKGYVGIVKDATDSTCKIELHAKCQTITVDRNRIVSTTNVPRNAGEMSHHFTTPLHGSQTPSYAAFGSRTPMIGNQTPMHDGSRTPYYGNMTPRHDGSMTPHAHGGASAWDPTYATTPRVDYDDDDGPSPFSTLNPTTPSYSHLADTLASGLGSSNTTGSSSLSSSSSAAQSASASLLGSTGGPSSVLSNTSASAYSPYSNHPTPSPAMPMDYQPYSSHIPTPGAAGGSFSSSNNNISTDQSSAGSYVYSPSINITPVTPSAQYAPMSTTLDLDSISNNDWHAEGLHVRIKVANEDESIHVGMIGVIQSISNGVCTVHLSQQDRRAVIPLDHMEPVTPKVNDKIYVIGGDSKGASGDLLAVDNPDGVVKLDGNISDDGILLINLKYLCKCN